jgi:hypothetical protein
LVTDPIERIGSTSVVTAGGDVIDVDAMVLATGFETSGDQLAAGSRRRYSAADDKPPKVAQDLAERSPDPALFAVLGVAVLVAAAQRREVLAGDGGAVSRRRPRRRQGGLREMQPRRRNRC